MLKVEFKTFEIEDKNNIYFEYINVNKDGEDYCKNFNPEDIIGNNKGRGKDKREKRNKYLSKEEKQALEDEKESKRSYRYYPA